MRLEASLQARQEMRLKLAPQIIQSIEILQLPLLDLRERIDEELLENPLLETAASAEETADTTDEEEPGEPATADEAVEPVEEEPETEETDPLEEEDYDALEDLIQSAEYEASYAPPQRSSSSSGEKDAKLAALENSPAPEINLADYLRRQLAYFELPPEVAEVCDNIIANLDWRGYLEHPLQEIVDSMEADVTLEQAEEALSIVQQLEPPGVAARDIKECLLLQLDEEQQDCEFLQRLISDHFEDIAKNRLPKIARAMDCSMDRVKEGIEEIAALNPLPGALFEESRAPHVIPDVRVELVEGEYRVILEEGNLPSLRICAYYARRLQQKDLDEKTEEYLRKKLQGAKWLIDAIQQRRSTVFNIATAIVDAQEEFFRKGPMHLKPLKMQDIADEVGVHVSTVSRAINGKYMQTQRGIYSMKHFFTGGVEKENGEMESWEVVRQKLQQIVDSEDKSNPLSDQQIADRLQEQGIDIARRTVSKYRKVLEIPSSRRRREY